MGEDRRDYCGTHQKMVDHSEELSNNLAKVETKLNGVYWLATAMFLAALGSIGALVSVSYKSGTLVQLVANNSAQIQHVLKVVERHIERSM